MARPKKERVICSVPRHRQFAPVIENNSEMIYLEADEYEVIRLHDLEHLNQAEVAKQMLVSRPTVALLLAGAHQKIADALVNGRPITIHTNSDCCVCEIGSACPPEKKNNCAKKHHCAASCRYEKEGCCTKKNPKTEI